MHQDINLCDELIEYWKDIPGYEGEYQVSTFGRVKSLHRFVNNSALQDKGTQRIVPERILKPGRFTKSGHVSVVLRKGTMGKPVHQLLMKTFVGESPLGKEVRHLNGCPTDNRLCNLAYGTRTENIIDVLLLGRSWGRKSKHRGLTVDDVILIRREIAAGRRQVDIAREMGITPCQVSAVNTGKSFKWLTDEIAEKYVKGVFGCTTK